MSQSNTADLGQRIVGIVQAHANRQEPVFEREILAEVGNTPEAADTLGSLLDSRRLTHDPFWHVIP